MPDTPRSYSTTQVAQRLGVSMLTIQRWVDAGHLKAWKTLGGHRRIDAHSAEQLFASQERAGLPAADVSAPAAGAEARASVLVVDDDDIDRELLSSLARKALPGARISLAANGFQGLMMAGRLAPTIIVTDIQMPQMNGFEMIRQLLADRVTRPRTVLAVSAHSGQALEAIGRLPAEVQFFSKPVDEARFVAALRDAKQTV